jgi:tellurite resistance protein
MKPQMNNQVFLALATVAWADGDLAPEERAGILSAARSAGYSEEDVAYLSNTIDTPCELSSLSLRKLSALDRVFVYATAEWLARLDGNVDQSEVDALKKLGDFMKVSEEARANARQAVLDIARLPTGAKPDRYDLVKLREVLEQNLRAKSH